jgi:hypothetical protein
MHDDVNDILEQFRRSLPTDAVRVYVRGFHDRPTGDVLRSLLEQIGFGISMAVGGKGDSLGGIVETDIMPIDELDPDDLDEIRAKIAAAVDDPAVFVQWRAYHMHKESDS